MKKVVIVGGGFSGLVAANRLKDKNIDFLLVEKNDRVGKKILATGNGRCNFSNRNLSENFYHGENKNFCEQAIKKYDNKAIEGFFEHLGVLSTVENGKVYPASLTANSILDALRLRLRDDEVLTNSKVVSIESCGEYFTVTTDSGKKIKAENVILAFGGKVGKQFGTDGSSYSLATNFGHKLTKLYASLVQMKCDMAAVKGLKGIKQKALVGLYSDKTLVKQTEGDLLFTDNGVSGNAIFFLSSYIHELIKPNLIVDFVPDYTKEEIYLSLENKVKAFPSVTGDRLLNGIVASRLSSKIAVELSFNNKKLCEIEKTAINQAIDRVKGYNIAGLSTLGFDNAQVTHGGIVTSDIDIFTFESKLQKGLYIVGEALDIDGDCGGYNLQFAFSSAMCAAEAIK